MISDRPDINERIRQYCEEHGLRFKPWEVEPADATHEQCPMPPHWGGAKYWAPARALRAKIVAELGLVDDGD